MKARQKATYTMSKVVAAVCGEHADIINSVPAFESDLNDLKAKIAEIDQIEQLKDTPLTGITADKTALKKHLAQTTADIAGLIYAYAAKIKNNELKAEVNVSISKLLQTRDTALAPCCQMIHDRGQTNLDAVKPYGLTSEKLSDLQTIIENYQTATPKSRTAVSNRTAYTEKMTRLIAELTLTLKDGMDKTIVNFAVTNPHFVATYKAAREIIDPAKISTQLKGKITNKSDGQPIKGATITVVEAELTAKTNASGEYEIKPISNGKYTIRVTATGFQDFEADEIVVKLGEVNKFDIELT